MQEELNYCCWLGKAVSNCFVTVAGQAPSVHGISQARIADCVTISYSRG